MVLIKKILPMEANLEFKNITEYLKTANIDVPQVTSKSRVFLLDAASYNNLGDQAITYAISLFLRDLFGEDCYFEISERDLLRNLKYLKKTIRTKDVLCLNGGGNMGNLYPRYEALRRKVIKTFPNNKVIIFPQTIDYENDLYGKRELERSRKIYNRHEHLVVCAREESSYEIMCRLYNNVMLFPDIVFYLKGKIKLSTRENCGRRIGICFRKDKEGLIPDKMIQKTQEILLKEKFSITNISTISSRNEPIKTNKIRVAEITNKLNEFNQFDCIITDRLHGMIFSTLADVPCIAVDNKNHKVAGVYKMLKDDFPSGNVELIELDKVDLIQVVRKVTLCENNGCCMDGKFRKLKRLFDDNV